MKIAIISDIHNNLINLQKVFNYCAQEKIETLICCGDLGFKDTFLFLKNNFSGKILYALGNIEFGQSIKTPGLFLDLPEINQLKNKTEIENVLLFKDFGEAEIDHKKIAFVHFPDVAKQLAETKKYDFVFHGHTHKPWEETVGNCKMLNPGNVAGEIYPPTFAIWETKDDAFQLIRIHDLK